MGQVMLVISDTSPITALLQIGQADLLPKLFDQVIIPPAVKDELLRFHHDLPNFLGIKTIQDVQAVDKLERHLDRGEAEAIVLAEEAHADYLLMDEKRGRSVAESRGLRVIGLLGLLLVGKKEGQVPSVGLLIDNLKLQTGFYVSDTVEQIILRAAGEGK
jgi:uncharacterized protein